MVAIANTEKFGIANYEHFHGVYQNVNVRYF